MNLKQLTTIVYDDMSDNQENQPKYRYNTQLDSTGTQENLPNQKIYSSQTKLRQKTSQKQTNIEEESLNEVSNNIFEDEELNKKNNEKKYKNFNLDESMEKQPDCLDYFYDFNRQYQPMDIENENQNQNGNIQPMMSQNPQQKQQAPVIEQQSISQIKSKPIQQPLFKDKKRQTLPILTNQDYDNQYANKKNGLASETKSNIKYTKTILKDFLKVKRQCKLLSQKSCQIQNKFQNELANFNSFQQLFGVQKKENELNEIEIFVSDKSDQIRQVCLGFFNSKEFVKAIIKGNMKKSHKLTSVKYMEVMRKSTIFPERFNNMKQENSNK